MSQTLAWKRVRGRVAVRTGCGLGWDGGRSRRGRWLAKEMTRSLPFVFTACVPLLFSWRLRRASGLRAPAWRSPSGPRVFQPQLRPAGSPQEEPQLGLGASGPGPGPAELLHPGAPRRGRGAGSPEAEPEVATEAGRRGGGAGRADTGPVRPRLRSSCHRVLDRKAPSDHGLIVILHYSCWNKLM